MKRLVILGGGESGWGTALLGKLKGYDVFLSDSGPVAEKYRELLDAERIAYEENGHTAEKILTADLVVKSPGIPDTAPLVAALREKGVAVISEIEFAGRYSSGRTICITGSNGKTTTATLVHRMLCDAGYDAALSGNIGDSYAAQVARDDKPWYVLELSSFQLDGMYEFRADIALVLNITPDHLDRYGYDMKKYASSKMRISANQREGDYFIYNGCDPVTGDYLSLAGGSARRLPFFPGGDKPAGVGPTDGAYTDKGRIIATVGGSVLEMEIDRIGNTGRHNTANAMAASLAALAAGVDPETIRATLSDFKGVEHRMEYAGTVDGVKFVNDSKATNTDAAWYAVEGTPGPLVWIAGGTDKGNDYSQLKKIVPGKVKTLVCLGADNGKLLEEFSGVIPEIHDTRSMDEALEAALGSARPGDTVLLSPACASFDLFRNYEHRGRLFKEWVARRQNGE